MTNKLRAGLLLVLLMIIALGHWLRPEAPYLRLNCHNELYDSTQPTAGMEAYMVADYVFFNDSARIYYRYFSISGDAIASLILSGTRDNRDTDRLLLSMDQFTQQVHITDQPLPAQLRQMLNTIERNMDDRGIHPIRMQVLERHHEHSAIIVQFEPSQAVGSCVYSD
ncbi:hypothetical protein [Ferrimonas pelagia]|uniref:FidL-like membrane protein n=1 Tax=Ferrimonas pelagia TaxID=1177826 RepID=A0ABP9EV08_9GAMM